jgi:hypothetical protein
MTKRISNLSEWIGSFRCVPMAILLVFFASLVGCKPKLNTVDELSTGNEQGESPPASEAVEEAAMVPEVATVSTVYPFQRTLMNAAGKEMPGSILGKEADTIAFQRDIDGLEFLIPLSQLSESDRTELGSLESGGADVILRLRAKGGSPGAGEGGTTAKMPKPKLLSAQKINWHPDFQTAQKKSDESGKLILLVFTGENKPAKGASQLPPDDTSLEDSGSLVRGVLQDTGFVAYVHRYFEPVYGNLLNLDELTPRQIEVNRALVSSWKVKIFPTVIIGNADGYEVARITGYDSIGSSAFQAKVREITPK